MPDLLTAARASAISSRFASQYDVARNEQLINAGCGVVERLLHIENGRWRQLNDCVVVLHNGPLTTAQGMAAAVLSAPAPVALAAWTAAARSGLEGHDSEVVHIMVPRGARCLPVPGVRIKVHESRRFSARDVTTPQFPPSVSVERAVVDAASWSRTFRDSARIAAAAVQQRLTTADRLLAELDGAGRIRFRQPLRSVLVDIGGGAQALSELAFLRFCRRNGLPKPQLQARVDAAGRRRYLDAVFVVADGRRIAVEIDGGIHLSLGARWEDTVRDNELALDGLTTLRFPSAAIYANDRRAVAQLRRALGLSASGG